MKLLTANKAIKIYLYLGKQNTAKRFSITVQLAARYIDGNFGMKNDMVYLNLPA